MTRGIKRLDLTGRLVAIVVAMVVGTGLLVTLATTLVMNRYLMERLDESVVAATGRDLSQEAQSEPDDSESSDDHHGRGRHGGFGMGEGPGTIQMRITQDGVLTGAVVDTDRGDPSPVDDLTVDTARRLAQAQPDGRVRTMFLDRLGRYRVRAVLKPDGSRVIAGLPVRDVEESSGRILVTGLALVLVSGLGAGGLGLWLVRRQLQPLSQVAKTAGQVSQLDLAAGAGQRTARVPAAYTDPDTQVGQVGAALNSLLAAMESALGVRYRSEQQVRQFVADASHELRTPLSAIQGYAELAGRSDDTNFLKEAATKMGIQASRMSGLVDDLLLLARIDAGRLLGSDEVDLARLAAEEVEQARLLDPERRYELSVPSGAAAVAGDEMRLRQVVTNLLGNAQRYTPAGTVVKVAVEAATERTVGSAGGDRVELVVSDNGPGMPAEFVPVAFDRFSRGDDGRSREVGGSGLGLAIVKAVVEAHGGTVDLTSDPTGTTYRIGLGALRAPGVE